MARSRGAARAGRGAPAAAGAPAAPADGAAERLAAALEGCERFLSGHGPERPRAALARLAEEARADERADTYGAGALLADFEREVADLLGKEAAVFMPSGTMAQQVALRIWSERAGCRTVAFHPTCHLELHEQKGYQALHGLRGLLVGNARRPLTADDLRAIHEPVAALLLELPQREIGGQLPEWAELERQTGWARERGVALHLDGARLWECGPFYDRPYAAIAGLFDSVYVSFYKGLGGLAGAALCGPAELVAEARVWQRRHGGNLIHLYPYVLAARAGVRTRLGRMAAYHARARAIADVLARIPGVAVRPHPPHTNMMHVFLRGERERLLAAAAEVARDERVALFRGLGPTDVPGHWAFELSIGDAAEAVTDDEVRSLFGRVME